MTKASFGSWISRGVISAGDGFFEEVVREAKVLDRGRKGDDDCGGEEATGEPGEEGANAGCEGESAEVSDPADCDLDVIGTVRFCIFGFEAFGDSGERAFLSSGGISSAGGSGRPLATATI